MNVEVRHVTMPDLPALVLLARQTFEDSFAADNTPENMAWYLEQAFTIDKITAEIDEPGSQYFVAEKDRRLVGYARVRESDEVKNVLTESSLELQRIYVDKNSQGLRVGVSLLQACIDYARTNRCSWLWLGVWERNFKAQEFYKKWGFEKFGEHVFQMGDDPQTDWLMKKRIES